MNNMLIVPPKLSIDPLTIHVDRSTLIVDRSKVNSVSIDPPKKLIDRLSVKTDSCTKSLKIRFLIPNLPKSSPQPLDTIVLEQSWPSISLYKEPNPFL
jgi:hypothetical protein